ncbi:hemolysin family protein [Saccharopolyspora phatthalungensis]|uniref:Putative hemolysin n=1 Tax=Saccharopolyspora phatthalungensis TaxID=664693 RepID=A0A840QAS2_9PSEU|nr:hemolysin family protein [Saccharopolyspora phatthalungensis]MBB5155748.1 putative hemolysin [Saccharopolyspora phatthalungensis]
MDGVAWNLGLVLLFVLFGGYFAAAEIALVSLRESQVRKLAGRDRRGARVAKLRADSNRFLSAVQIGVTFAGFFASSYGGATIAVRLEPVLAGWGLPIGLAASLALVLVTLFVSYLSLVLGELAPKRLALQKTEAVALVTAGVLDRVAALSRPLIWLLSKSTNAVVRLLGIDPRAEEDKVSEEELRDMVRTNEQLTVEERRLLSDAFRATDRVLAEVMVPRTEVAFLHYTLPLAEAIAEVANKPHSRYPVIRETADDVVGFIHVRDLLTITYANREGVRTVGDLTRPVTALPASKPVLAALTLMRRRGGHLAVVVDEYGGTAGIVTVEDLVEEVVGEIWDEYDPSAAPVRSGADGNFEVDGLLHHADFEQRTGIALPEGPYDTVAGFVVSRLGRVPTEGDSLEALGHRFTVRKMDGHRVSRLLVTKLDGQQ